jgi:hypothetical protein
LFRETDAPNGWGVLAEVNGSLHLARRPAWHDNAEENRVRLLERIAVAGTRQFNRQLGISFEQIEVARQQM